MGGEEGDAADTQILYSDQRCNQRSLISDTVHYVTRLVPDVHVFVQCKSCIIER